MSDAINLLNPDKAALLKKWENELAIVAPLNKWDLPEELAWWAEYATHCTEILELGCYNGASTKIMLLANPEVKILGIDRWDDAGTKETFDAAMQEFRDHGRLKTYWGSTERGLKQLQDDGVDAFDGLVIDAGHTKEDVARDITLSAPLMRAGSLICGHDFHEPWADNGVSQAVKELLPGYIEPIASIWAYQIPV